MAPMIKFALHSDTHFEFCPNPKPDPEKVKNTVDLVLLPGDIDQGIESVRRAAEYRDIYNAPVVLVPGNHEFYGGDIHETDAAMQKEASKFPGVYYANGHVHKFDTIGVRVIGCTLWSEMCERTNDDWFVKDRIRRSLADYRAITNGDRRLRPDDTQKIFQNYREWITNQLLEHYAGKTIVLTHHGPLKEVEPAMFYGGKLSPAFTSDLSRIVSLNRIDAWAFGHTHHNVDFKAFGTRVVSNQAGYPHGNEGADYDAHKAFVLPTERDTRDLSEYEDMHDLVMSMRSPGV